MSFWRSLRAALRPIARIVKPLVQIFGLGTDAKKVADVIEIIDRELPPARTDKPP